MPSVLFVLSASDRWTLKDGTRHETGFWAEEFVVPHDVFADAGWDVTVATPGGVAPTVDETGHDVVFYPGGHGPLAERILADAGARR